jgi:hypothetical protein
MKPLPVLGLLLACGCAAPRSDSALPPEVFYSGASVAAAAGGTMALAIGQDVAQDDRRSRGTRNAGTAAAAAGAALTAAALVDAVHVEAARARFLAVEAVLLQRMMGTPAPDRPAAPPAPAEDLPWLFRQEAPVTGGEP